MRRTIISTLTVTAVLTLGACSDDSTTAPSSAPGTELAKGGSGKGKGGKPGADRIVYTHKTADGFVDIYTMNPDGSNVTRLLPAAGYSNWSPRWTPDHGKIVFVSNRTGSEKVFIMDANGSNAVQLTQGGCADRNPAPSPDGSRIAFQRACAGGGIFLMNLDGSNQTQVTFNSADTQPSWVPNGSQVIFANNYDSPHGIWRANVDGSNRFPIHSCSDAGDCRAPMLSPDGSRLAFWTPLNEGEIVLMTFNTYDWIELAHLGTSTDYAPTFSPDGSKLVFTAGPYGTDIELYSVNAADGSGLTRLTTMTGPDAAPSWHR